MDFKAATDRLTARVTADDIAEALSVSRNTVERARMEGGQSRPAPSGWRATLARLARERGGELVTLAEELEKGSE